MVAIALIPRDAASMELMKWVMSDGAGLIGYSDLIRVAENECSGQPNGFMCNDRCASHYSLLELSATRKLRLPSSRSTKLPMRVARKVEAGIML